MSLFVTEESAPTPPASDMPEIASDEFVIPGSTEPVSPAAATLEPATQGEAIDFQALYDQAGIPDTDEVEALEKFLQGLDDSLPQASKIAAAKAFLGAIGKKTDHVLEDAARKIAVVRTVLKAREEQTDAFANGEQAKIDELTMEIDKLRAGIETSRREMERVRGLCIEEESRLQAARVFFGHMGPVGGAGGGGGQAGQPQGQAQGARGR